MLFKIIGYDRIKAPQLYYITMVKHKWKYVLASMSK